MTFLWSDPYLGPVKTLWPLKQLFILSMKTANQTKLGDAKNKLSLTCGILTQCFLTATVVRRHWSDRK